LSILDPHPSDGGSVRFDELANALLEQGELVSPAELHGCLCGLVGGGFDGDDARLLEEVEKTSEVTLHGPLADAVVTMRNEAVGSVTEGSLDFEPVLPDDDLELRQRIEAMASWCRAFLTGYAQARVSAEATGEAVATDSAEALRDFAAIAQAAVDDEESDDAEREGHYYELLEYLRVAAMNVLLDASPAGDTRGG